MRCSEPYGCTRCVRGGTLAKQSNGLAAPPRSRHRTDAQQWCACHWLYRRLSTATPTQRMRSALRQLACCNTLATQTSVAQIGLQRCYGSLRGHPGASGVIQRQRLWVEHTASTRAVLPDPDWRGEGKRPSAGDSSTSSNASVDAWDDAAQAERHQGGAAPTKAPVAGQVFQ